MKPAAPVMSICIFANEGRRAERVENKKEMGE